tara:strand:+ start:698 stop:946 length:249 start_codon:yes stop_codon:yes gene_type:complete
MKINTSITEPKRFENAMYIKPEPEMHTNTFEKTLIIFSIKEGTTAKAVSVRAIKVCDITKEIEVKILEINKIYIMIFISSEK